MIGLYIPPLSHQGVVKVVGVVGVEGVEVGGVEVEENNMGDNVVKPLFVLYSYHHTTLFKQ